MKYHKPANLNLDIRKVDNLLQKIGRIADGRLEIVDRLLNNIDWDCQDIFEECEDGNKRKALGAVRRLKKSVAKFESVTAILTK